MRRQLRAVCYAFGRPGSWGRNILAYGYFGISLPIIWDVVQNKLDDLTAACSRLVSISVDKDLR